MFNQKGFLKIALIIIVLILIGGAYFVFSKKEKNITAQNIEKSKKNAIPYVSVTQGFQIVFPSQPKILETEEGYYFLGDKISKSQISIYSSTEFVDEQELLYKVIVDNNERLPSLNDGERKKYHETVHAFYHELMKNNIPDVKVTKIFFDIKNVQEDNSGVEYQYAFESGEYVLVERGLGFIKDGKSWQISVFYPLNLQGEQIEKRYSDFISSFATIKE